MINKSDKEMFERNSKILEILKNLIRYEYNFQRFYHIFLTQNSMKVYKNS